MKTNSTTCWRCSRPTGLTLIEVLAAIAILGAILVGVVLAKSRHSRQLAQAERQAAAVRAADELIAQWWTRPQGVPVSDSGVMAADPSLAWRTRVVRNAPVETLGARVVRVEVLDAKPGPPVAASFPGSAGANMPLVAVDLVLPAPAGAKPADPSTRPDRGAERSNVATRQ